MSLCYTFAMELSNINFYLVILYGYVIVALLLLYFFNRDRKNPATRLGRNPWAAYVLIAFLVSYLPLRILRHTGLHFY
jgi:hypothetical protein